MSLLNYPCAGGLSVKPSAREESQKRIKRVLNFFGKPSACQALRRGSLVLQLTSCVETFMSEGPATGGMPVVVELHKGKVHDMLNTTLQRLIEGVYLDPQLDVAAAICVLLGTAGDLNVRLMYYMKYPYKFVKMVAKWFPSSHRNAITTFLQAEAAELDVGFSLALQRLALAEDGEMAQRAFLLRRDVQEMLENAARAFLANSLSAERAAAEVKRKEGRNITLIGNVSRDLLCRRFTHQRDKQAKEIELAQRRVEQLRRSGWHAIAWERHDTSHDGVRFTSGIAMPATGGGVAMPATGGDDSPTKRARTKSSQAEANVAQAALKEECKAERNNRLAKARAQLDLLMSQASLLPCTRIQWAAWLGENIDELRVRMRPTEAPTRRRALSCRTSARHGMPPGERVQPVVDGASGATTTWGKLLELRTGWYGLQTDFGRRMFYMLHLGGVTYVIDMESHRQPQTAAYPYRLTGDFKITDNMMPLTSFETKLEGYVVAAVYEFTIACDAIVTGEIAAPATGGIAAPATGCILIKPVVTKPVTTSVKAARENDLAAAKKNAEAHDSCEEFGDLFAQSDIGDDAPAVDTDHASLDDSGNTTGSAQSTDSEIEPATDASHRRRGTCVKAPAVPATGGKPTVTNQKEKVPSTGNGERMFDNGFFYAVARHQRGQAPHIRMYISLQWVVPPPKGIGKTPTFTRSIAMSKVGDTDKDPIRTMILLKAWMIWRVRQHPDWLTGNCSRQRLFTEEADQLCLELKRMQPQTDGLLGHPYATKLLRASVPDLVAKLTQTSPSQPQAADASRPSQPQAAVASRRRTAS